MTTLLTSSARQASPAELALRHELHRTQSLHAPEDPGLFQTRVREFERRREALTLLHYEVLRKWTDGRTQVEKLCGPLTEAQDIPACLWGTASEHAGLALHYWACLKEDHPTWSTAERAVGSARLALPASWPAQILAELAEAIRAVC